MKVIPILFDQFGYGNKINIEYSLLFVKEIYFSF